MTLDLTAIRQQFPALERPAIFLDNPAGTQVARTTLARMQGYLRDTNANHDGAFATSRASDALIDAVHKDTEGMPFRPLYTPRKLSKKARYI